MAESGAVSQDKRNMGLLAATGVGVSGIVGGGILVLAGVAFAKAGPSAMVAIVLNGGIAILTALSFAEMSTAFPQSGGPYTFAKKVLSVRAAFGVGWVLWFAYMVSGVLYAMGFASYTVMAVQDLAGRLGMGTAPWLSERHAQVVIALCAIGFYTLRLSRTAAAGGQIASIGKLAIFAVVIIGGLVALSIKTWEHPDEVVRPLSPFFFGGATGLIAAMGYAFIALQGFDLIAAVAGEVKDPSRNIPRAMLYSLGVALGIYIPLLFCVCTVGVAPGQSVASLGQTHPETMMALAVQNFLGSFGYLLIVLAAVLATLSALAGCILGASRVAQTMAQDRTLPKILRVENPKRHTPVMALYATALTMVTILAMVPNLSSAGAAASLIFLVSYSLAHLTAYLARKRATTPAPFQTPAFPLVPVVGGGLCAFMALFQAVTVPSAGGVVLLSMAVGGLLYRALFADRAETLDAYSEGADPSLVALRGRNPLVLVPLANEKNAQALTAVAGSLAPPLAGRILLFTVMKPPESPTADQPPETLRTAQEVLSRAWTTSFHNGYSPEALMTVAPAPWPEIARVARAYHCNLLVLGLSRLDRREDTKNLEALFAKMDCDVAVLRAPEGWRLSETRRVLVPVGGRGPQDELRARLLGSLVRTGQREITFLRIMHQNSTDAEIAAAREDISEIAAEEAPQAPRIVVDKSPDVPGTILAEAEKADLLVLGMPADSGRRTLGDLNRQIAAHAKCAVLLIARGR
ncbi:MAG: amino acid permease [Thermodesulfobacteriota bacterium]